MGDNMDYTKASESFWQANRSGKPNKVQVLTKNLTCDIAIVGAGITGLTAALILQKAGQKVIVLEAREVGSGVSGFNSGHLTTMLLDMKYKTIVANFGIEPTTKVLQALQGAL